MSERSHSAKPSGNATCAIACGNRNDSANAAFRSRLISLCRTAFSFCCAAVLAARERKELLGLSDRELRDIGLSRADAKRLAKRSLWQTARAIAKRNR